MQLPAGFVPIIGERIERHDPSPRFRFRRRIGFGDGSSPPAACCRTETSTRFSPQRMTIEAERSSPVSLGSMQSRQSRVPPAVIGRKTYPPGRLVSTRIAVHNLRGPRLRHFESQPATRLIGLKSLIQLPVSGNFKFPKSPLPSSSLHPADRKAAAAQNKISVSSSTKLKIPHFQNSHKDSIFFKFQGG